MKAKVSVIFAGIIGVALITVSSSAFRAITTVGPHMKSCWRLTLTSVCYLITVLITWSKHGSYYLQLLQNDWRKILLSGCLLGLHFSLWTLSLELTSIAHSLLFLTSSPFFAIVYYVITCKQTKPAKTIGVFIGFIGMIILCIGGSSSEGSTLIGDLIALAGSFAILFNFMVSEEIMQRTPWFFLWAMHCTAAIFCWLASITQAVVLEGTAGFDRIFQTFGYLNDFQGVYAALLGIGVGFIGNGMFYYMLRHTSALVVNVIFTFEPVTGTLFAWMCGFQKEPSLYTWIGGAIVLIGNFTVTVFSELKEKKAN